MKSRSLVRMEWVSLVYLALFVLAVLSPSLVTHDFFGLDERHVEEALIFLFGLTGLVTFSVYQRIMEKKEKEHQDAKSDYERAKRELVESYQYIGSINRQFDVLKKLANQTSHGIIESSRLTKDLVSSVLANAAATVQATHGCIRYVDIDKLRTVFELSHPKPNEPGFRISNKELRKVHDSGASYAFSRTEDGKDILIVPSDNTGKPIRTYIVIGTDPSRASEHDTSLLKVFANQAELLHYTLAEHGKEKFTPMDLVEQTEKSAIGEVG